MKNKLITLLVTLPLSGSLLADNKAEGYYGSFKIFNAKQRADNMDSSDRPGVGQFVSGKEKKRFYNSSIAFGYQYGNGWRTEAEYTFKRKSQYTSGSSIFTTSYNHHKVDAQRLMINAYRDFDLMYDISIYGMLGVGVARIESSGWQGNETRKFSSNTDTNLIYSVGVGISYTPISNLSFDLGYRFVDLGRIESGINKFQNVRGLQDERMKAHIKSNEMFLGVRYALF